MIVEIFHFSKIPNRAKRSVSPKMLHQKYLIRKLTHLDVGDPRSLLEPVFVEELHALQGVHRLHEADVFGELRR